MPLASPGLCPIFVEILNESAVVRVNRPGIPVGENLRFQIRFGLVSKTPVLHVSERLLRRRNRPKSYLSFAAQAG